MEEWLLENWPLLIAGFAVIVVITSIIKKVIKLAILAGIVAAGALFLWPAVSESVNF